MEPAGATAWWVAAAVIGSSASPAATAALAATGPTGPGGRGADRLRGGRVMTWSAAGAGNDRIQVSVGLGRRGERDTVRCGPGRDVVIAGRNRPPAGLRAAIYRAPDPGWAGSSASDGPHSYPLRTMTLVVKLGSSIVADDDGELRADVLDSVCGQVAELHDAGEEVAMVTSGAIALGCRLMELPTRPRTIDELQAASAVGQGDLFRAYETRLRSRRCTRAQVLLTASDLSARTHYLNARQALRRLIAWRVVPVVNENDTTATDEITFGDNDFLSAQVAILMEARLLVLLTNIDGLYSTDPATEPVPGSSTRSTIPPSSRPGDRRQHLAFGSGGMRSKVAAAEMASAAGIAAVICHGTATGTLLAAAAARPRRDAVRTAREPTPAFKLWLRHAKPARGRITSTTGAARVLRERGSSLLPVGIAEVQGEFAAGDAVDVAVRRRGGRQGDRQLLLGRDRPHQGHEAPIACAS